MMSIIKSPLAPELIVSDWINTHIPISLKDLRGQVVILHAFQMLCPGCVSHGIPQAKLLHSFYTHKPVQVIGLHSVFEHHQAMNKNALKAFAYEYKLEFPIAIDQASKNNTTPLTMQKYKLRGTPSLVIIDSKGRIRLNHFGQIGDLHLGNMIGSLIAEQSLLEMDTENNVSLTNKCDDNGCTI
jgi:peroxiredoxin